MESPPVGRHTYCGVITWLFQETRLYLVQLPKLLFSKILSPKVYSAYGNGYSLQVGKSQWSTEENCSGPSIKDGAIKDSLHFSVRC